VTSRIFDIKQGRLSWVLFSTLLPHFRLAIREEFECCPLSDNVVEGRILKGYVLRTIGNVGSSNEYPDQIVKTWNLSKLLAATIANLTSEARTSQQTHQFWPLSIFKCMRAICWWKICLSSKGSGDWHCAVPHSGAVFIICFRDPGVYLTSFLPWYILAREALCGVQQLGTPWLFTVKGVVSPTAISVCRLFYSL
jgi:hypothetical protein